MKNDNERKRFESYIYEKYGRNSVVPIDQKLSDFLNIPLEVMKDFAVEMIQDGKAESGMGIDSLFLK
jgi:hypothetical protein